jgi:hypothetical protein
VKHLARAALVTLSASAFALTGRPALASTLVELGTDVQLGGISGDTLVGDRTVTLPESAACPATSGGVALTYRHAFSWTHAGGFVDLGTLGGCVSSAVAASPEGIIGLSTKNDASWDTSWHAFVYSTATGMTELPLAYAPDFSDDCYCGRAWPVAIGGDFILGVLNGTNADGTRGTRGIVWMRSGSTFTSAALPTLCGSSSMGCSTFAAALDASADGQVHIAGYSTVSGGAMHAVLWTVAGSMFSITDLEPQGSTATSEATGIRNGQVVGIRSGHAFLWTSTTGFEDIGTLASPYDSASKASGVSNGGIVVGSSFGQGNHAFAWTSASGVVDINPSGYRESRATAISDTGQMIAGSGAWFGDVYDGHSFVLLDDPPAAVAGTNQHALVGQTIRLDGSGSSDDNTPSLALSYSWTLSGPDGSAATLIGANTAFPTFVADVAGDYVATLVVTDSVGLSSAPSTVAIGSEVAPIAFAGPSQVVVVGSQVTVDGSQSIDPDGQPITYAWTLSSPSGSSATLAGAGTAHPTFTADVAGEYKLDLVVYDVYLFPSAVSETLVTAVTGTQYSENQLMAAQGFVAALPATDLTANGTKVALQNFISQALAALQAGQTSLAVTKIEQALSRTDGCELRGRPDGSGPGMDWITTCDAQGPVYAALESSLSAVTH